MGPKLSIADRNIDEEKNDNKGDVTHDDSTNYSCFHIVDEYTGDSHGLHPAKVAMAIIGIVLLLVAGIGGCLRLGLLQPVFLPAYRYFLRNRPKAKRERAVAREEASQRAAEEYAAATRERSNLGRMVRDMHQRSLAPPPYTPPDSEVVRLLQQLLAHTEDRQARGGQPAVPQPGTASASGRSTPWHTPPSTPPRSRSVTFRPQEEYAFYSVAAPPREMSHDIRPIIHQPLSYYSSPGYTTASITELSDDFIEDVGSDRGADDYDRSSPISLAHAMATSSPIRPHRVV